MSLEDQQFEKWLRRPTEFIANAWFLLASAGQYVLGYAIALLAQLLGRFGFPLNGAVLTFLASGLAQVCLFMLPVVIYALNHDGVEQSMRMNGTRPVILLLAALAAPVGVLACDKLTTWWMLLIESLGGQLHSSNVPIPSTLPELGVSLILYALLPGACEELLFRGGLMGAWERRGTRQALIITSVLFALLHGSVLGLPVQLIMGFVLGFIVILSNSLFTGMIYHIVHNASTLIFSYLSVQAGETMLDPYSDLAGYIELTGGCGILLIQTIIWAALYGGILFLLIRSLKKRGGTLDQIIEGDKKPMEWQELIVLLAGLLTVGVTFMNDLLTVCGAI